MDRVYRVGAHGGYTHTGNVLFMLYVLSVCTTIMMAGQVCAEFLLQRNCCPGVFLFWAHGRFICGMYSCACECPEHCNCVSTFDTAPNHRYDAPCPRLFAHLHACIALVYDVAQYSKQNKAMEVQDVPFGLGDVADLLDPCPGTYGDHCWHVYWVIRQQHQGCIRNTTSEYHNTTDIHALFTHYNALYFENVLGAVSVEWSTSRMTRWVGRRHSIPYNIKSITPSPYPICRCAGVCQCSRTGGIRIVLSEPLLKVLYCQQSHTTTRNTHHVKPPPMTTVAPHTRPQGNAAP